MRAVIFGPEDGQRYSYLYDGLTNTKLTFQAPSETRVIGRVLTKLEAIGTTINRQAGDVSYTSFDLANGGATVLLEDAEHALALKALKEVPWNARGSRIATDLVDWFEAAPKPEQPQQQP